MSESRLNTPDSDAFNGAMVNARRVLLLSKHIGGIAMLREAMRIALDSVSKSIRDQARSP